MLIKNILVILHVITAAGWFGLGLILASLSKQAGPNGAGAKAVGMMNLFSVLTLVFGLLAFFMGGGFGLYGPVYHTSILLVAIMVAVQFLIIRKAWSTLMSGGEAARKKLAMGTGILHLLWLVVLILMFWNRYPLA